MQGKRRSDARCNNKRVGANHVNHRSEADQQDKEVRQIGVVGPGLDWLNLEVKVAMSMHVSPPPTPQ